MNEYDIALKSLSQSLGARVADLELELAITRAKLASASAQLQAHEEQKDAEAPERDTTA